MDTLNALLAKAEEGGKSGEAPTADSWVETLGLPPLALPVKSGDFLDAIITYAKDFQTLIVRLPEAPEFVKAVNTTALSAINNPRQYDKVILDDNGKWHRALVLDRPDAATVKLYYVDTGVEAMVRNDELYAMPDELLQQPAQAIMLKTSELMTMPGGRPLIVDDLARLRGLRIAAKIGDATAEGEITAPSIVVFERATHRQLPLSAALSRDDLERVYPSPTSSTSSTKKKSTSTSTRPTTKRTSTRGTTLKTTKTITTPPPTIFHDVRLLAQDNNETTTTTTKQTTTDNGLGAGLTFGFVFLGLVVAALLVVGALAALYCWRRRKAERARRRKEESASPEDGESPYLGESFETAKTYLHTDVTLNAPRANDDELDSKKEATLQANSILHIRPAALNTIVGLRALAALDTDKPVIRGGDKSPKPSSTATPIETKKSSPVHVKSVATNTASEKTEKKVSPWQPKLLSPHSSHSLSSKRRTSDENSDEEDEVNSGKARVDFKSNRESAGSSPVDVEPFATYQHPLPPREPSPTPAAPASSVATSRIFVSDLEMPSFRTIDNMLQEETEQKWKKLKSPLEQDEEDYSF